MTMTKRIVDRIIQEAGVPNLLEILMKLPRTDLQSLLLEIYEKRVSDLSCRDLKQQYRENRFVSPCTVSQRELLKFDQIAYDILPKDFEPIELSPVAPLGVNSILARINQKTVLSTIRNVEVVADPTTVLALECARRRKEKLQKNYQNADYVKLATSNRSLRLQVFSRESGFTPHFKTFTLATAGRDVGFERFEELTCIEHLSFYLDLLEALNKIGYSTRDVRVSFSDIRITEALIEKFNLDRHEIGRNTQNDRFNLFERYDINLPALTFDPADIPIESIRRYQVERYVEFLLIVHYKIVLKLRQKYPSIEFNFDLQRIAGIGYYQGLCFKLKARNKAGRIYPLADGGCVDWTQKLIESKKERLLISGFGSELFCKMFRA